MAKSVVVIGHYEHHAEAEAAEAITPGHVIAHNSSGKFVKSTVANGGHVTVACENDIFGKGMDDAYASGDRVLAKTLHAGAEFMGFLPAAAAAITNGGALEVDTAAPGLLKTSASTTPMFRACESVDNSAGGSPARIRVRVMG